MGVAKCSTNNAQLRIVKKKTKTTTIKDEVRHIQQMRKQLVHQLPQIFTPSADPQPVVIKPEKAVKVQSTGLVKTEHDDVPEHVDDVGNELPSILSLVPTMAACALSLNATLLDAILPPGLSFTEGSSRADRMNITMMFRVYMGCFLALLVGFGPKRHRDFGMLVLCAMMAEIFMQRVALDAGYEVGLFVSIWMAGVKVGLGRWLIGQGW